MAEKINIFCFDLHFSLKRCRIQGHRFSSANPPACWPWAAGLLVLYHDDSVWVLVKKYQKYLQFVQKSSCKRRDEKTQISNEKQSNGMFKCLLARDGPSRSSVPLSAQLCWGISKNSIVLFYDCQSPFNNLGVSSTPSPQAMAFVKCIFSLSRQLVVYTTLEHALT